MKILVESRSEPFQFECSQGDIMLHAGLSSGMQLPHECGSGTCGACKASLVKGMIDEGWPNAPGKTYLSEGSSEFLMCQATPKADCTIQVRGKIKAFPETADLPAKISGQVVGVKSLTHDVYWLEIRLDRVISFSAGQFMLVATPEIEGFRAYSMASYAQKTDFLNFVVKRAPDGGFTNWLVSQDRIGAGVDLFGPLGIANYVPPLANNLVLVAGGSGLAPMLSILDHATKARHFDLFQGDLFFGVRKEQDMYLLDQLQTYIEGSAGKLKITIVLSDETPTPELASAYPEFKFETGFVHDAMIAGVQDRWKDVRSYLAGPPPMIDATLRALVTKAKQAPSQIRYDKFS